ncbi:hypothetical protein H6G65_03670 [Microcystis elabens FACHB-917]|nr:hypothetical protein [Microcystis elabens FACHB-917]
MRSPCAQRLHAALPGLVLLALIGVAIPAPAAPTTASTAPQRSLLQKLRTLLGLNPPIATGGSRQGSVLNVCLITPWLEATTAAAPIALVPITLPTIVANAPLNEVRLERNGALLWQRLASSSQPIEGAIPWPLESLKGGESLQLRLRPRGASGGDFADVTLTAAPAVRLLRTDTTIRQLGSDPAAWLQMVDRMASDGEPALAMALLFATEAPASATITQLRKELVSQGCRKP